MDKDSKETSFADYLADEIKQQQVRNEQALQERIERERDFRKQARARVFLFRASVVAFVVCLFAWPGLFYYIGAPLAAFVAIWALIDVRYYEMRAETDRLARLIEK